MRKTGWFIAAAAALLLAAGLYAAEKTVTIEGTLVDSKCYAMDSSLTGNDHGNVKECGTMCLKGGSPGGVLTKDKKFHAVLAPSPVLAPYVGKTIRVEGSLLGGSIVAKKVEVNQNGKWEEIKLGGMM